MTYAIAGSIYPRVWNRVTIHDFAAQCPYLIVSNAILIPRPMSSVTQMKNTSSKNTPLGDPWQSDDFSQSYEAMIDPCSHIMAQEQKKLQVTTT